jgi:hypothetical protein
LFEGFIIGSGEAGDWPIAGRAALVDANPDGAFYLDLHILPKAVL